MFQRKLSQLTMFRKKNNSLDSIFNSPNQTRLRSRKSIFKIRKRRRRGCSKLTRKASRPQRGSLYTLYLPHPPPHQ